MRKLLFIATVGVSFSSTTMSATVPKPMLESLSNYAVQSATLDGGVLRLVVARAVVTEDLYTTVLSDGVCYPAALGKLGKNSVAADSIEVLNQSEGQGFSFRLGWHGCFQLAKVPGTQLGSFIQANTWVCNAGFPCRPRRAGD